MTEVPTVEVGGMQISLGRDLARRVLGRLPPISSWDAHEFLLAQGVAGRLLCVGGGLWELQGRRVTCPGMWDAVVVLASLCGAASQEVQAVAALVLTSGRVNIVEEAPCSP